MSRPPHQHDVHAPAADPATIDYETPPAPANRYPEFTYLLSTLRRLVFAGGAALLAGGLGVAINPKSEGAIAMAGGAAVLSFYVPLPRHRRREN